MTEDEKWDLIIKLDDELLVGGVILSEYVSELIRNVDLSFVAGANWAAIITSIAAMESYFRSEYNDDDDKKLYELINESDLEATDKDNLHNLRRYRNTIVHVKRPWDDEIILNSYDKFIEDVEQITINALRLLRKIVYSNPWI